MDRISRPTEQPGVPSARLRRSLAARGVPTASRPAAAAWGRADEARTLPAELVEGDTLTAHPVGAPRACPEPIAFLDGVQSQETVGYVGAMPLVLASVAAAVRLRVGGRLRVTVSERRQVVLGRPSALAAAGTALETIETVALPDDLPEHPIRDIEAAHHAVDGLRGALEVAVGHAFRSRHPEAWLIVDGSLAESTAWAADARMLGLAKSHATLPFEGEALIRYLHLPAGQRTSLFRPASRRHAPVHAWGLRLWPWEGRDLFHGLVRIEAAPTPATLARADEFSRWILAERVPISAPDPRWDRLLYGVRGVEMGLRSGGDW